MTKAIVVYMSEDADIYAQECESIEEAKEFISHLDAKAYLVSGDNLNAEGHT